MSAFYLPLCFSLSPSLSFFPLTHIHSLKRLSAPHRHHLFPWPPSARSSCDRSMVIDGLPSVQIYTCKGRACVSGGESRAGDYIQSLSFCQREMESHYLTALFPLEHITLPSLCLSFSPSIPHILPVFWKTEWSGDGTQGRMRTGRRGQAYAFPHSVKLYINK